MPAECLVMSTEEDRHLDLTIEDGRKAVRARGSGYSKKFATSSSDKFRDIFYQQISDPEDEETRRRKLLGGVAAECFDTISCSSVGRYLLSLVPILTWLPAYRWRENMISDLVAGLTVAIMHIPQGMAYAMLAGVEPVSGIYTGIWPVMVYVMLGNMPHTSMGTFAVVCILVNQVVEKVQSDGGLVEDLHSHISSPLHVLNPPTTSTPGSAINSPISMELVTAITFSVGVIQTFIGLLRLGSLTLVINDVLISSFTTGASIHVATSQVSHVLGLVKPAVSGPGKIVQTYIALGRNIMSVNLITLALSVACLALLLLSDLFLSVKAKKYCRYPLPTQLLVVIVMTFVSNQLDLSQTHGVRTIQDIGDIPNGFPAPSITHLALVPHVILQSIPVAVVATVISYGLGTMLGAKHGYTVPANQECVAQGLSNLVGSLLSCLPMVASLSRSLVQESSGCKSLLTSLISSLALIAVLLTLANLFGPLPICALAAIILSSLVGMFRKMADLKKFWARSPYDGILWLVTFLATVLVQVEIGLGVGVAFSILITLVRSSIPSVTVLEDREAILRDNLRESFVLDDETNVKVIQVKGPINFLSLSLVKTLIRLQIGGEIKVKGKIPFKKNKVLPSSVLEVNIVDELKEIAKMSGDEEAEYVETKNKVFIKPVAVSEEGSGESDQENKDLAVESPGRRLEIILNLSHVTWMDVAGCDLITWLSEQQGLDAVVVESHLEGTLSKWKGTKEVKCNFYKTLTDALTDLNVDNI